MEEKKMKKMLIAILTVTFVFCLGGIAMAFHGGGVAHCNGCHTMHNSQDGAINANGGSVGSGLNSNLTKGTDPSSTCLNCHVNIYTSASADGNRFTPGGDFYWLTRGDIPTDTRGGIATAESHGHNIVAVDYGYVVDPVLASGPSDGTVSYPSASLGCQSCHDPHGKKDNNVNPLPIAGSGSYGEVNPNDNSGNVDPADGANTVLGNFRLLGGVGYDGGGVAGINFAAGDPVAVSYHGFRGNWPAETDTNHTDYGSGMSEFCANCHSGFTADGSAAHRHPSSNDAHMNGEMANYNAYVTTGNMTGAGLTAFDRLVPFERGIIDSDNDGQPDVGLLTTNELGATLTSNVMCITCHRAHATAWPDSLKWDPDEELIAHSAALADPIFAAQAYYGDDIAVRYSNYQRSLCNKCHVQD
jgi:hypothetical protein